MDKDKKDNQDKLITRDWLAVERTKLANERTFLAYFRTGIVFLASGISILKLDVLQELRDLGIFLTTLSPVIILIGIIRLVRVKRFIRKYYK